MSCTSGLNSDLMKLYLPSHKTPGLKGILFFISLAVTSNGFSQTSPALDFRSPVLEAGVDGADGAQYRFSAVAQGVDALVQIARRSDVLVNLLNPDMTSSGFDRAFQPQVGYNNGTAPGAADWWMEFHIQFVESGTTTPMMIEDFNVSGVDIDGNSQYINEYLCFFDMNDYSIEAASGLSVISLNEEINGSMVSGKRYDGPVSNYANIDTGATTVMVTNHYVNKSAFTVRAGGRSTDVSGAADRMYSFYFQNFAYGSPVNSLLSLRQERVKRQRIVSQDKLLTYPNPVVAKMNIKLPSSWAAEDCSISIYDMQGRLVNSNIEYNGQHHHVDMSDLKPGMYFLHVKSGNERLLQKIVKL